jgi:two-component system LytT family response regulator
MAYRTILVDDERLARIQLRTQLRQFPEIEVIAEADSAEAALNAAQQMDPDLVFLDIQMPGQSGFDFLEQATGRFRVILVTAFDQFALRAFEVNALDYLLKPVSVDRLANTVGRLSAPEDQPKPSVAPLDYSDYLFLAQGLKSQFLKVRAIKYVLADGSYTHIFSADGQKWTLPRPIKEWEDRLPGEQFVRIHRRCIINLNFVERVEAGLHSETYQVLLRDLSTPLPISRRYALALKNRFR